MFMNQLKTAVLLASLAGLLMLAGYALAGQQGVTVALIMAIAINSMVYFFSSTIVLNLYRAKPLDTTRYARVHTMAQELSNSMRLPKPQLWLVNTPMANAFATGRNPRHAHVAITTGILDLLNDNELRAVLAHELSHVKNRDILIGTIAATMATAIGYVADMARYTLQWGAGHHSDNQRRHNPLTLMVTALLMPFAALLIQLAISRTREYMADESGAYAIHDPLALADALEKLHKNKKHTSPRTRSAAQTAAASLFIVYPFSREGILSLFSTHPPVQKRIERLRRLSEHVR